MNSASNLPNNDWNEEEVRQLQDLLLAGVSPGDIAARLGRSNSAVETRMTELGVARLDEWTIWFTGREHGGSWDDSWRAERHIENGGHVHYHTSNNRTFASRSDAIGSAITKGSQWVFETQPVEFDSTGKVSESPQKDRSAKSEVR